MNKPLRRKYNYSNLECIKMEQNHLLKQIRRQEDKLLVHTDKFIDLFDNISTIVNTVRQAFDFVNFFQGLKTGLNYIVSTVNAIVSAFESIRRPVKNMKDVPSEEVQAEDNKDDEDNKGNSDNPEL